LQAHIAAVAQVAAIRWDHREHSRRISADGLRLVLSCRGVKLLTSSGPIDDAMTVARNRWLAVGGSAVFSLCYCRNFCSRHNSRQTYEGN